MSSMPPDLKALFSELEKSTALIPSDYRTIRKIYKLVEELASSKDFLLASAELHRKKAEAQQFVTVNVVNAVSTTHVKLKELLDYIEAAKIVATP
jgi:predicted transcriptional regulator